MSIHVKFNAIDSCRLLGHISCVFSLITILLSSRSLATVPPPARLTVSLPDGLYSASPNATSGLTVFRGIRYAAPPTGLLRWQAPQPVAESATNSSKTTISADTAPAHCPQTLPQVDAARNGLVGLALGGSEDCLFVNVWTPTEAVLRQQQSRQGDAAAESGGGNAGSPLPVLVWIHGGGYGLGDASSIDMTAFVNAGGNGVLVVAVQYRLGAFGFLASPEVKNRGVLNAGLLDQKLGLEWVQANIAKFGGDPGRVTVSGESAGAGSVLLHAIAQNGATGTKLFKNIIAASPWIPTQPFFDEQISVRHYTDFASAAGCTSGRNVFDCLVAKDSLTLQYAANRISGNTPTPPGNWAFIPVTDGTYVIGPPSQLLAQKKVNGVNLLVGNNANEGVLIVPANIVTQDNLVSWIKSNFINLSQTNIIQLIEMYPSVTTPTRIADTKFETNGLGPATAVNISQVATGQQQRAFNMYAEASVICPSYWFASSFAGNGHTAFHYQYSVPFASHGADISAYFGPPTDNQGALFVKAFQSIFLNFIQTSNPLSEDFAAQNLVPSWPAWTEIMPHHMLNLNISGGTPYTTVTAIGGGRPVTQFREPGLRNNFTLVDADIWEGGRGTRCEFWKRLGPSIPQ